MADHYYVFRSFKNDNLLNSVTNEDMKLFHFTPKTNCFKKDNHATKFQ